MQDTPKVFRNGGVMSDKFEGVVVQAATAWFNTLGFMGSGATLNGYIKGI